MAGAKTHEMLFTLAAKQQASFGSAFSSARQEFQSLYNEAAALTKQQADISAYQKQQSAVESTRSSLARYEEKLQNVRNALARMAQTGEGTTQETLKLQQQEAELAFKVSETSRKLTEQEEKLGTMGSKLNEAGIDTDHLSEEQDRLQGELNETKSKMDEIDGSGSFMDSASESLAAFGSVAAAVGVGKIFESIAQGLKDCADAAAEFEFGMSAVEAIANASTEDMEALNQKALDIGASTMFTATQAADALSYMALAGWNSAEMLEGVDGVIQLAAASGEDLASVSDIVTDALTAFGLSASDSAGFVDVLAAAAANSNTTVNMLGEAFKYAAPVAGALGYSVEDVAVAMGLMANNGIKGSMAGTTLRNIFSALTGEVELSADAFGDIEVSAVNADGTMMGFSDTLQMLKGYFDQMTDAEKVNNAQALVGTRAYAGLLAILNTTEGDYNSLTAAIENSTGAAERMANTRMDNMTGQLTLLESAFNGLQIAIGNNFAPALTGLYKEGASVLSWMTDVVNENPQVVAGVTATAIAVGGLTTAITAFNAAKAVASKIGLASLLPAAGAMAAIGAVAAIVGTLAVKIAEANKIADEAHDTVYELTYASREQADEIANLTAQYDAMVAAGEGNSAEAVLLKNHIEDLTAEFESSKQSATEFYTEVSQAASEAQASWAAYHDNIQSINDQEESTMNLIARLQELSSQTNLTAGDEAEMAAIVDELNSRYEGLNLTMDDLTGKEPISLDTIKNLAAAAAEQARFNAAYEQYGNASLQRPGLLAAEEAAQKQLTEAYNEWKAASDAVTNAVMNGGTVMMEETAHVTALKNSLDEAQAEYDEVNTALEQNTMEMESAEEILQSYTEAQEAATGSVEDIRRAMKELEEEYGEVYAEALESFQGQFSLFEQAPEIVAGSVDDVAAKMEELNTALASQATYFEQYGQNLDTIRERIDTLNAQGYDTSGLEAYITAANDGSTDAAAAFAAIASASDEALVELNNNYAAKEAAEASAAAATAEMETDFSTQMAEMEARIQEMESSAAATLDQLASDFDKSSEAGAAGVSMMNTYNSTLLSYTSTLYSTGRTLTQSFVNGMNSVSIPTPSLGGYATGTENAMPGWAWVGEAGPELMRMRGGEQILNHEQSMSLMHQMEESAAYSETSAQMKDYSDSQQPIEMDYDSRGSYTEVTISPVIQITGVGNQADMQAISDELMDRITETVMDAMEEAGVNARRGQYR